MKRNIMNIDIRGFRAVLAGVLLSAVLFAGCVKDPFREGGSKGTGERVYAKMTVELGMNGPSELTRAVDFSNNAQVKFRSIWVGAFDTKTGELLGYKADNKSHTLIKSNGTAIAMNNESGNYTVEDIDIYYYDNNPYAYIVSVANFDGVKARFAGTTDEFVPLSQLLGLENDESIEMAEGATITWEDFCRISVDTKSADAANVSRDNWQYPLLMGHFLAKHGTSGSANNANFTHSQAHPTVDHYGKFNRDGDMKIRLVEDSDLYAGQVDLTSRGRIYFQRLLAEVNVYVRGMTNGPSMSETSYPVYPYPMGNYGPMPPSVPVYRPSDLTIKSLAYRIVNKPLETYLVEHATDKRGPDIHADEEVYLSRTANSADYLGAAGYESDGPDDWTYVTPDPEGNFLFSYQHYENKHWGRDWKYMEKIHFPDSYWENPKQDDDDPDSPHIWDNTLAFFGKDSIDELKDMTWGEVVSTYARLGAPSYIFNMGAHFVREAKIADNKSETGLSDLFMTLCLDDRHAYNNNASYIVLKADISVKSQSYYDEWEEMDGTVYYTIHEGCTSRADGTAINSFTSSSMSAQDMVDLFCDYQTVRNTQYNYFIGISGMETLMMQTILGIYGDNSEYPFPEYDEPIQHDDGITGNFTYTQVEEIDPEDGTYSYSYGLPPVEFSDVIKWRFFEHSPDGDKNYGTFDGASLNNATPDDPLIKAVEIYALVESEAYPGGYYTRICLNEDEPLTIFDYLAFKEGDKFMDTDVKDIYFTYHIAGYPIPLGKLDQSNLFRRGFYFEYPGGCMVPVFDPETGQITGMLNESVKDKDGCEFKAFRIGYEQDGYDPRWYFNGSYYGSSYYYNIFSWYNYTNYALFTHYNYSGYGNYNGWRLWQGAQGMTAYMSFYRPYDYRRSPETSSYEYYYPVKYDIQIERCDDDGYSGTGEIYEFTLENPDRYTLTDNYGENYLNTSYSSYTGNTYVMCPIPIPPDATPGLYYIRMRPQFDPYYYRPIEDWVTFYNDPFLYIHEKEWDFSISDYNELYNNYPYSNFNHKCLGPFRYNYSDYRIGYYSSYPRGTGNLIYEWGGITLAAGSGNGITFATASANMNGSGNYNSRSFRFTPSVPGTFVIKALNTSTTDSDDEFRRLYLSFGQFIPTPPSEMGGTGTSEARISVNVPYTTGATEYALSMKPFMEKFSELLGPEEVSGNLAYEFAIYCKERLFIYDIKFVPASEDQALYDDTSGYRIENLNELTYPILP